MVPQPLVEDILGALLREPREIVPLAGVVKNLGSAGARARQAIKSLERQGLVDLQGDSVSLTAAGRNEGQRLVRAHRLWETYLEHVGAPAEQLHEIAHHLEHVNDGAAVDYLDDKLGHPLRDPHGSEIPADVVHLVPGAVITAAQLRDGDRATVQKVGPTSQAAGLVPGMEIIAGPRQDSGRHWTFVLPGGQRIELNHAATDEVAVRFESAADKPSGKP
jgi:manganese/iron transport system permease protein/iron/zinc/copper transport system permease protein